MRKALIILGLAGLTACGSYKSMTLTSADADRAAKTFPGSTLSDLSTGKAAFEKNCVKCHSLNKPFWVNEKTLKKVMPKMAKKAHVDDKTQNLIYVYLVTVKDAPKANKN